MRDTRTDFFRKPSAVRAVIVALGGPVAVTAIATNAGSGRFVAQSLYILAVVLAAAVGGAWSGIGASAASFLGLNYYFTPPYHTFRVGKLEDIVSLLVFLVIAGLVAALFARLVAERARAERREQETQILNFASTKLLAAESIEVAIGDVARTASSLCDASRCIIQIETEPDLSVAIPPAGPTEPPVRIDLPITAGSAVFGTVTLERATGARPFSATDHRLLTALANQLGLALERRRLDLAARTARDDAEINRIRAALFSSVTHDLRTPLASIKAGVTSLLDEDVRYGPSEREELLRTVLEETDRLNRLVGNLLNLARARAGGLAIEKQLTPFEDVIEAVLSRMRRALEPFEIFTAIDDDLPPIWIDALQMDQALTNILENAARHSPRGGKIRIAVSCVPAGIRIEISDEGPGIPPSERERVFEPFYSRDAGDSRRGSGLGLAIARAVVQAHDGTIGVEDGDGATIVIELPVSA